MYMCGFSCTGIDVTLNARLFTLSLTIKGNNSIFYKAGRSPEHFQEAATKLATPSFGLTPYLTHLPLHCFALIFMLIFPAGLEASEGLQL